MRFLAGNELIFKVKTEEYRILSWHRNCILLFFSKEFVLLLSNKGQNPHFNFHSRGTS